MCKIGKPYAWAKLASYWAKGGELSDGLLENNAVLCAHAGLVAFVVTAVSTLLSYENKLKAFMADIAGEDLRASGPSEAAAAVKGD